MKTKKKRVYTYVWYIEPPAGDSHSNELIARELNAESALRDVPCADGKRRNLWRCTSYEDVTKFRRARQTSNIHFTVYAQRGNGGIRPFAFASKKRKRTTKPATTMRQSRQFRHVS